MNRQVYNLEFPFWCPQLTIAGYTFSRVPEYEQMLQSLQHLVGGFAEFRTEPNIGQHAITSMVQHPDPEPRAVLEWSGATSSALDDILLLLSLFTKRDVFAAPPAQESGGAIIRDPRVYAHGGALQISIPFVRQPIEPEPFVYDIGFQQGLMRIYELISNTQWRDRYRGGYFLFLANQAFRRQSLEASFVQCWTIWEHLFSVNNQRRMSAQSIRTLRTHEKIAFVLSHYNVVEQIDSNSRSRIEGLSAIRHRLVHFGRFPDEELAQQDALLFIRLTEWVLAKTVELEPSNALNTQERLQEFLQR